MGMRKAGRKLEGLGLLDVAFPLEEVRAALAETERDSRRKRKLPAVLMVYYSIALGLMCAVGARTVLRHLLAEWREDEIVQGPLATESAITQARQRLGVEPLKRLFERVVRPLAPKWLQTAWYRSWRVVTLDGSTIRLLDTDENEARYGRPSAKRGTTAYPQLRLVGVLENGTRILFGLAIGAYRVAENTLARAVIRHLKPGMLCLADRGFFGYELWDQAHATGADLLWRIKSTIRPRDLERLPDGSYRARLGRGKTSRHLRLIQFTLTFKTGKKEHYRLLTTISDYRRAPAEELARLYSRRWTIETMLSELKVRIGGPKLLLRSATPDLVEQDVYGLLLAHFGVRHEMLEAAREDHSDPADFSFAGTLAVIIRRIPELVSFSPSAQAALP